MRISVYVCVFVRILSINSEKKEKKAKVYNYIELASPRGYMIVHKKSENNI